jgi:hypothetical protein
MSKRFAFAALVALASTASAACALPSSSDVQGGANVNDRSAGGEQGETLLTGAMVVSSSGRYVLAQRNRTSVLVDVETKKARELPQQVERFVFSKSGTFAIAVLPSRAGVVRYELPSLTETWRVLPAFKSSSGAMLARLTDDGRHFVLGDADRVLVMNADDGDVRGAVPVGSDPAELTFLPGKAKAVVVGTTRWSDHLPATDVVEVDLSSLAASRITVPNCTAPMYVLPDASRGFLSPTFCEENRASTAEQSWTNPDPVSVVDLGEGEPKFLRNLPGFGPVVADEAGSRVVAYLDMKRIDESMFEDKSQIPSKSGPRYHIMTIDPRTLAFGLAPVGDVLPRFAMAKDGKTLLVDATVQNVRGEASLKATFDPKTGTVSVKVSLFGGSDSLFGSFDLDSKKYTPFAGAPATLDRFVQLGDGKSVFSLAASADGMGGDLHAIDLQAHVSKSLGKNVRDIGLLADGKTLVLRERLPAVQVTTAAGFDWYRRERYCFSLDGITCLSSIEFQDSTPFQSGNSCTDYHDC